MRDRPNTEFGSTPECIVGREEISELSVGWAHVIVNHADNRRF